MTIHLNSEKNTNSEVAEETKVDQTLVRHGAMHKIKPLQYDPVRKRFEFTRKRNVTVVELDDTKCKYKRLLFDALNAAHYLYFQTDDYTESRRGQFYHSVRFWSFIRNMDTVASSIRRTSNILKEFEAFHLENYTIISSQATGVQYLTKLLSDVLEFDEFYNQLSQPDIAYLHALTKTKAARLDGKRPNNLNYWFSSQTWLRVEVGHDIYSRLSSPRKLMHSFRITAEETLLSLQYAKVELYDFFKQQGITIDDIPVPLSKKEMEDISEKRLEHGEHKKQVQRCYYQFLRLLQDKFLLREDNISESLRFAVDTIVACLVSKCIHRSKPDIDSGFIRTPFPF